MTPAPSPAADAPMLVVMPIPDRGCVPDCNSATQSAGASEHFGHRSVPDMTRAVSEALSPEE
jgi:hypothetical protein